MTNKFDVTLPETLLKDLISLVRAGTEVLLTEGGKPLAKLVPVAQPTRKPRVANLHSGAAQISDDFDAPLPEEFWTGNCQSGVRCVPVILECPRLAVQWVSLFC